MIPSCRKTSPGQQEEGDSCLEDNSQASQSHSLSEPQVQSAFARVSRIYIIWLSNRTEHRIENNGWRLVDLVQSSSSFSRHVNLVTYPSSSYISFAYMPTSTRASLNVHKNSSRPLIAATLLSLPSDDLLIIALL